MREIGSESGLLTPVSAHNLAKSQGPPPLAVTCMLGSPRERRQANLGQVAYHFSITPPIS